MTELTAFTFPGADVRFGVTEDGDPYAIASDYAKALGYRDAANATRILDADEWGYKVVDLGSTHETSTPTGSVRRRVSVIYEDGLWELIFRSTLPGAKTVKKKIKEILREIRKTGRYEAEVQEAASVPAVTASTLLIGPGRDPGEVWTWLREGPDVRFLHALPSADIERAA